MPMYIGTVLVGLLMAAAAQSAAAQVSYDRKSGRLSATFAGAPLRDVLTEVSARTGVIIYIDPAVDKVVFIERKDLRVDEMLDEIIAPLNRMFIYKGDAVTAVRIYEQSPADAMQKLAAGRAATEPAPSPGKHGAPAGGTAHAQAPGTRGVAEAVADREAAKQEERAKRLEEQKAEREEQRKRQQEHRDRARQQTQQVQ